MLWVLNETLIKHPKHMFKLMVNYLNKSEKDLPKCVDLRTSHYGKYSGLSKVSIHQDYMGYDVKKPVFGVSNKLRLKPVCSATETS